MKKEEQKKANQVVLCLYNYLKAEMNAGIDPETISIIDSNHCIFETRSFIVLKSYESIVAFVDKASGKGFDVLRYVYGVSRTSAKRIYNFLGENAYSDIYTYRDI